MVGCGITALLVGLTMPVAGQQQMPPPASETQENALRNNVRTFELALKTNVISAGVKLAQWAGQLAPNVPLMFAEEPKVRSVILIDDSLVFHVEVSEILQSGIMLFNSQRGLVLPPPQNQGGVSRAGGTRPVSGMAVPDPNGVKGAVLPRADLTPDQYYTELVYQALVDTILDSAAILPLKEGQKLTVACNPVDVAVTNPLNRNPSKQLILTFKGEDVLALRQGTLSRDDAKQRIIERRF